jgi:hypothetical protein
MALDDVDADRVDGELLDTLALPDTLALTHDDTRGAETTSFWLLVLCQQHAPGALA